MKFVSWNVNGLRAVHRKGEFNSIFSLNPDILLLQETKASPEQLSEDLLDISGYNAYFSSSEVKKGYSGTALYTKKAPCAVEYGLGVERFDNEGRIILAHFDEFSIYNIYFPNGGMGPHRLSYKLEFYDAFLEHAEALRKKQPNIIFAGDVNTAHEANDLARSRENEKNTGFLPEERAWLDEVVAHGYVDTFRHFHPERAHSYTYWDMQTRARDRNVGWRIDYFFVSHELLPRLKKAAIHSNVFGSDHCPISIDAL